MALRFANCFRGVLFCKNLSFSVVSNRRCLLSEAYSCHEAWRARLKNPLLQKIDPYEFATKLQESYDRNGTPTAVDLDILANKLSEADPLQLDFFQNLFYRYRHSREAKNVLESMSHALIRALLDFGETERLLTVLRDKIHFGIFLDDYSANLLLNHFLTHTFYKGAAEIAIDQMLQEDFSHPLTRLLSWYAIDLRLKELQSDPEEIPNNDEPEDDGEMKYRRINYIAEPWYDDHFDIPTEKQRLGKALTIVAKLEGDTVLSRSFQLVGWGFYEKFDVGLDLMDKWQKSEDSPIVSHTQLETFGMLLENIVPKETPPPKEPGLLRIHDLYPFITAEQKSQYQQRFQELCDVLKKSGKVADNIAVEEELLKLLNERINTYEPIDIAAQTKLFEEWVKNRTTLLEEQVQRYQLEQKKRNIAKRLLELKAKEEKLRYFEQRVKIDLKISQQPVMKPIEDVVEEEQFVAPPGERKVSEASKKSR